MNRTYSQKEFLDLAHHIRKTVPDIVLSTDVSVGFPTETEEEFQDTLDVIDEVKFDSLDALAQAMQEDARQALDYFATQELL